MYRYISTLELDFTLPMGTGNTALSFKFLYTVQNNSKKKIKTQNYSSFSLIPSMSVTRHAKQWQFVHTIA